jgi:hypothetical protein
MRFFSLIIFSLLAATGCGADEQVILLKPQSNPTCTHPLPGRARSLLVRVVEAAESNVGVLTQHDQCLDVDIPLDPAAVAIYFRQRGIVVSGVNAELKVMLAIYGYEQGGCSPRDAFGVCLLSEVVSPEKKDALPIRPACTAVVAMWGICKTIAKPELGAN